MTEIVDWNTLHHKMVETVDDADMIADIFLSALSLIEEIVENESSALRNGRIEDALSMLEKKQNAAVDYGRAADLVLRNIVALTRFIPERMPELKDRQTTIMIKLNDNAKLIATLRSLSESLLRGVAQDANAKTTLSTYGQNGKPGTSSGPRPPARAIILSTTM